MLKKLISSVLFFVLFPVTFAASSGYESGNGDKNNAIIPSVTVSASSGHLASGSPSTIITKQDIDRSGAITLPQILEQSGGVQLRNLSGNSNEAILSMRGFGANAGSNTLLLVNGIPVTNPDMASPKLNLIPVEGIDFITIISGSESVQYGDQAVGGVINIHTLRQATQAQTLSCGSGSYNRYSCYGDLDNQIRNIRYNLHANIESTDNYRNHNQYYQQSFSSQLESIKKHVALFAEFNAQNEMIQFPGALTATQVRKNRRQSTNQTDFFRDTNTALHLSAKRDLGEKWDVNLDFSRRQMAGHGVLFSPFTQGRWTYFMRPELVGKFNQIQVNFGSALQADSYHLNSAFGPSSNKQKKIDIYGMINKKYSNGVVVVAGMRGALQSSSVSSTESNTYVNRAMASTIGVTQKLQHSIKIYARMVQNYRFPKADENASTSTGIDGLRTQRGISYETGISVDKQKYSADLNVYQLNLRDEIAFDPTQTVQQPFGSNQNLPPTMRRGLSLSGKLNLSDNMKLDSQLNLVDAKFRSGIYKNNRIPLVAETVIHSGLSYQFKNNWRVYLEAAYTGNQYSDNDNGNVAGAIGGYTLYNASLGYKRQNVTISFRVNNIFSKPYYVYTVYQQGAGSESFYPAPEMNYTLTGIITLD